MKKIFSFAVALLFAAAMMAADWSAIDFLGDGAGGGTYTNKYKMSAPTSSGIVNIQQPGFATEAGIYATFPEGITECSLTGTAIQGAGIVIYLSNFTAQETAFTVTCGTTVHECEVYYADGTPAAPAAVNAINPYAFAVSATATEAGIEVAYSLNADAAAVELQFCQNGAVAATAPLAGLTKGAHTETVAIPAAVNGVYTLAVAATGIAHDFTVQSIAGKSFTGRIHATVDAYPASANFGNIYVSSRDGSERGAFFISPDYNYLSTEVQRFGYENASWGSMQRGAVAPNGEMWFSSWSDGNSGIHRYDPSVSTTTVTQFFLGTRASSGLFTNDGAETGCSTPGIGIYADGANSKLYMVAEDFTGGSTQGSLAIYNIGQADGSIVTSWGTAPSAHFNTITDKANTNFCVAATRYGAWLAQHRAAGSNASGARSLQFISNNGVQKYLSEDAELINGSMGAGVVANKAGDKLYLVNGDGNLLEFNVAWGADTVPTLTLAATHTTPFNAISQMTFDFAGNIVASADAVGTYTSGSTGAVVAVLSLPATEAPVVATPIAGEFGSAEATPQVIEIVFRDSLFSYNGDGATRLTTIEESIKKGAEYVSSITNTNAFLGRNGYGLKLGSSSKTGTIELTLANAVKPDSIVVRAAGYSATEGALTYLGESLDLSAFGNKVLTDAVKVYDGNTEVSNISVGTSAKRAFIRSITIFVNGGQKAVKAQRTFAEGDKLYLRTAPAANLAYWKNDNAIQKALFINDNHDSIRVLGNYCEADSSVIAFAAPAGDFRYVKFERWNNNDSAIWNFTAPLEIAETTGNYIYDWMRAGADGNGFDTYNWAAEDYTEPAPVVQMIANPLGADGRFIVKYDCEAGAWATANPEVGETFTFAVDVTGSWLEEWLAAPAAVSGAQRGLAINKWTSRGDLHGDAVRFKHITGNIWGMTANFSQQAQGWAADALANDSTTTVYGQLFGFEYTDASAGAAWWQWDGHDVVTTQAAGTDGLFQFAPSTGVQDDAFTTADMTGAMYGYNVAGYAEPCATVAPTLVWTKQATYTNVPESWNTESYTYPAIYTSDNIQEGMKVTVEKWSDNRLVVRNWLNSTDAGYDGYTDVEITYTPGESYATVTALGGNAQSVGTDGTPTAYFYTGWPSEIYYAYFYTNGSYTYIDDNEENGYIYNGYYIYNSDGSWGNYVSYYLTFEEEFDHDLYNPAQAAITNTYFATGDSWTTGEASTATLDAETGDITVHIDAVKANQWQSQVFFTPGFDWEEGATYTMEFKLRTNNQLGGVTVKINNDGEGWYYSYPNDNFFLADQNTKFETGEFVAGAKGAGNGEIILAFGWVAAGTDIVISDIRISKTQDAPASDYPERMWIIGNCATAEWVPANSKEMTKTADGIFEVEETLTGTWFSFIYSIENCTGGDNPTTDWDVINSHRYGSNPSGENISDGAAHNITGVNGDYSFTVSAAGTYKFVVDLTQMTVTATPVSALDNVELNGTQKIFRDGKVIILRGGHEYSAQGQLLK